MYVGRVRCVLTHESGWGNPCFPQIRRYFMNHVPFHGLNILIPTHLGPNALNAALYALELHGAEGNTFTILYCCMMPHGQSTMWNIEDQPAKTSQEALSAFTTSLRAKLPGAEHRQERKSERVYLPEVISVYKGRPGSSTY